MSAVSGSTQVTAVILTALPSEFKAVYAHGEHWQTQECNNTLYKLGIFPAESGTWDVIIAQIGAGNVEAALRLNEPSRAFIQMWCSSYHGKQFSTDSPSPHTNRADFADQRGAGGDQGSRRSSTGEPNYWAGVSG